MSVHGAGVAWREWSEEAFADAKAQDKPVLLDIGAVWCHWCHVMDEGIPGDPNHTGTYSNPEVQKRIAENYIAIKVDNDKRPDINARYNMGGWPTTAFLTPDGETLYGKTYVPPQEMIALLDYITNIFKDKKDEVSEQIAQMKAQQAAAETEVSNNPIDPRTVVKVLSTVKRAFDSVHGGFGSAPKFPHPETLTFTLEQYAATGDPALRDIAEKTLQRMDSGGMYDRFAGGFFRYSTTRDWSIPHFEKMLEDNAKLTAVYALASIVLADAQYLNTVKTAHHWLFTDMFDQENRTFAGSQDADKEEEYYGRPLAERAKLPTPFIDRTTYTNWNALMVSALVARYRVTEEQEILIAARETFQFLRDHMEAASCPAGVTILYHYYVDGRPQGGAGLLTDQTDFIAAALDLFEVTGETDYLTNAVCAAEYVSDQLEDHKPGGFFDIRPTDDAIGELARPKKEISANADTALAFLRLSIYTEKVSYRQSAERALELFANQYPNYAYFASQYARAVQSALAPALHVVIVGDASTEDTKRLMRVAWKVVAPGKVVEIIDSSRSDPATATIRGYPPSAHGASRAYVCIGTKCLPPVEDSDQLRTVIFEALEEMHSTSEA
jgi:uncharacterized protein YyaL (SSP411 family)